MIADYRSSEIVSATRMAQAAGDTRVQIIRFVVS